MTGRPTRRDVVKTTAKLAAAACIGAGQAMAAPAREQKALGAPAPNVKLPAPVTAKTKTLREVDAVLRSAVGSGIVPGVVAMAATDDGVVYEGVFGQRRLHSGPAMTRDTVFRVASMVKLITSVAAMQLVEQDKLSLDAPVPKIEAELGEPQVLDGFGDKGAPQLRPAKSPISLRQLLTHTAGFSYRLWDAKALQYSKTFDKLPAAQKAKAPHKPLMFDPGARWHYGPNIDWVGRIVEQVSGDPIGVYFRKHICGPLGMNDSVFILSPEQQKREASVHQREANGSLVPQPMEKQSPNETFTGGGGIYSTASDYLTLIRALMQGGALGGVRILRPDTVALMGENQIGDVDVTVLRTTSPSVSNDVDFFPGITLKWGFGHMINMQAVPDGRSAGSLTWGGICNTYYWVDPAKQVAAVFMTQIFPFADHHACRVYRQFERSLYAAVKPA